MPSNSLRFTDRIEIGKGYEEQILTALNGTVIRFDDQILYNWRPCNENEDIYLKTDAYCHDQHNNKYSVQIKNRETGSDVGVAVLRPWKSDAAFLEAYRGHSLPYDRDAQTSVDFYVCRSGKTLLVVPYELIKRAYTAVLKRLYDNGGFKGRNSFSGGLKGLDLRIVRDKGEGYSMGHNKLILYINNHTLVEYGARGVEL